jgi:hypothetical protein
MSMEIVGKVKHVGETQVFDSGFQKRLLIVECQEEGSQYVNDIGFELLKDNVTKLDGIKAGHEVEVKFNLARAREYNGKWYGDMHTAWYIKKIGAGVADSEPPAPEPADDVPF